MRSELVWCGRQRCLLEQLPRTLLRTYLLTDTLWLI